MKVSIDNRGEIFKSLMVESDYYRDAGSNFTATQVSPESPIRVRYRSDAMPLAHPLSFLNFCIDRTEQFYSVEAIISSKKLLDNPSRKLQRAARVSRGGKVGVYPGSLPMHHYEPLRRSKNDSYAGFFMQDDDGMGKFPFASFVMNIWKEDIDKHIHILLAGSGGARPQEFGDTKRFIDTLGGFEVLLNGVFDSFYDGVRGVPEHTFSVG